MKKKTLYLLTDLAQLFEVCARFSGLILGALDDKIPCISILTTIGAILNANLPAMIIIHQYIFS